MTRENMTELQNIAQRFCDDFCRLPREISDPELLEEKCNDGSCPLIDMANLVERAETAGQIDG